MLNSTQELTNLRDFQVSHHAHPALSIVIAASCIWLGLLVGAVAQAYNFAHHVGTIELCRDG